MTVLKIQGKEYKIKFGYNCFCDTDLMDRVNDIAKLMSANGVENDDDVRGIGKIRDLFCVVRELLFVGFGKHNPIDDLQAVGELLDDYMDEETEEKRGIMHLFEILSNELMNEGFLAELMSQMEESAPEE